MARLVFFFFLFAFVVSCGRVVHSDVSRSVPIMAWDHRPKAAEWTRATLSAVHSHGAALLSTVPEDVSEYCPGYVNADVNDRAAFWSGILSALAKHESTWRPEASGGGGQWIGLTQIDPRTARAYDCDATTVSELKVGAANLSCAVRIAGNQVGRDGFIVSDGENWRGLARDWAPFRKAEKRQEMASWTSRQAYCQSE